MKLLIRLTLLCILLISGLVTAIEIDTHFTNKSIIEKHSRIYRDINRTMYQHLKLK